MKSKSVPAGAGAFVLGCLASTAMARDWLPNPSANATLGLPHAATLAVPFVNYGMRAQVRVTEYWSDQYYSTVTRQCVSRINERPVPQTISLLATTDGWKIITVEFHDKSEAQVVQCR